MSNLIYDAPHGKVRSRAAYTAHSEKSVIQTVSVFVRMQNADGFSDLSVKSKLLDFGNRIEELLEEYFPGAVCYEEINTSKFDNYYFP